MMWNNAPCHHTKKNHYSIFFYFPFDHGVTYCIFVITCCDKFRCHEFVFFKKIVNKKVLMPFAMMYMFVNNICTR